VSIVVIYVALGLLITLASGSPATVYELSTNVWMNMGFFAIFMVFAFSFLGAFEIKMPDKWVNNADKKADKGGLIGIFFMAFTLALVSFSCTGPIIGSSLVQAVSSGSMGAPVVIMAGFSIALALPFMLFALALKFFSMVDLAYHWDILTRELFVAIWFLIFAVIGFYLLGKLRFAHDSVVEKLTVTRFMFAFSSLAFAIYLLPGMWGAPLNMIDGIAPPRTHSEDGFRFVKGENIVPVAAGDEDVFAEYRAEMHDVADGSILVFHDLDIAHEYAAKVNKPVLVDFTGHSCANCRKTENTIWTKDKVRPILQNKYVIVSLYCDDREELPLSEQVYSEELQGKIKTVGNKWCAYQIKTYQQLSQPLYIIQDNERVDLSAPRGYLTSVEGYAKFLNDGLKKYEKENPVEKPEAEKPAEEK
jgi:thiol:disulfide interchange protein